MAYNDDIFRAQAEEWAAAIHNVNFPEDIALGCAAFVEAMADAEYAWREGAVSRVIPNGSTISAAPPP